MYTADELEIRCALAGSPRADELIACLEGEIAKRDEELAACRVAVENCDLFRARIVELDGDLKCAHSMLAEVSKAGMALRAELSAIKAQEPVAWAGVIEDCASLFVTEPQLWKAIPLYAAPVSEANAQGVVQWPEADEIMQMAFEEGQPADDASGYCFELEEFDLFIERLMSEVARLNAAPVQQVSVPDDAWKSVRHALEAAHSAIVYRGKSTTFEYALTQLTIALRLTTPKDACDE